VFRNRHSQTKPELYQIHTNHAYIFLVQMIYLIHWVKSLNRSPTLLNDFGFSCIRTLQHILDSNSVTFSDLHFRINVRDGKELYREQK